MGLIQYKLTIGGRTYNGPTLTDILANHKNTFAGYSQREVNSIYRWAGNQAGELWITVFLPKRWDPSYAKMLGYHSSKEYDDWKVSNVGRDVAWRGQDGTVLGSVVRVASPQPTPMYLSGESKRNALSMAYPSTAATSGKLIIKVKVNAGKIKFKNADVFYRIPANEYRRVVEEVNKLVHKFLAPLAKNKSVPLYVTSYKNPRIVPAGGERPVVGIGHQRGYA